MKLTKEIIEGVQNKVHTYCTKVRPCGLDEDDICQEIFLRIIESQHLISVKELVDKTFDEVVKMSPAIEVIVGDLRKDFSDKIILDDTTTGVVNKVTVQSALNKLLPMEKQVVYMRFGIEGAEKTPVEIAEATGIPVADVEKVLDVILAKMR